MEFTGERLLQAGEGAKLSLYEEHVARYKFAATRLNDGELILDIACGSGYGTYLLSRAKQVEVWGGDIDKTTIQNARDDYERMSAGKIHFQLINAEAGLPFEDNFFDKVVSFETIEHLENYKKFIKEIERILKPGGKLILSTPNRTATEQLAIDNPFHIKEFNLKELKEALQNFKKLDFYGQRPITKMNLLQKVWQRLYIFYRSCGWLHWLEKIISPELRQKSSRLIEAVEENYQIEPLKNSKEYLYLVVVGEKENNYKF